MADRRYTILEDPDRDGTSSLREGGIDGLISSSLTLQKPEEQIGDMIAMARRDPGKPGSTVFLIGAGCSVTAGIPTVEGVAKRMVAEVADRLCGADPTIDPVACYMMLIARRKIQPTGDPINWHLVYDEMFRRHYTAPDDVRSLFSRIVDEANGAINWAHLILGELVARNYVSTVLTTNFDQLVLAGMVRAGVIPVVSDGLESLNRISSEPLHPQLIEIHGSRHTYTLRNQPDEVAEVAANPQAGAAISGLLHAATTFVVVGYGGREAGVMDLLVEAARSSPNKNLIWVAHGSDPTRLSAKASDFLNTGRNSFLLPNRSADAFFFNLAREMGIGSPTSVRDPLRLARNWLEALAASTCQSDDITREISAARRRLDAGERCMTSVTPDPVSEARELRLGGNSHAAWVLLKAAGGVSFDAAVALGDEFVDEQFLSAHDLFERYADPDVYAFILAYREWRLSKAASPRARGDSLNDLGVFQSTLGTREGDAARLGEAVATFRAALDEYSREHTPLNWAMAQNNLGTALMDLAEYEGNSARLEEAVVAFRAALEEYTRERVAQDWARTQNNLANALKVIGVREDNTARLEEAVAAYREVLEVLTRERSPLDWAGTQHNLASALSTLGEREGGTARLEEAVASFQLALEERTRERVPLEWAMTLSNLGNALVALAERERNTVRMGEAVEVYRAALEERTRERLPLSWAITTGNCAGALCQLASWIEDCALARQAAADLEEVVSICKEARHGPYTSHFSDKLARARSVVKNVCG